MYTIVSLAFEHQSIFNWSFGFFGNQVFWLFGIRQKGNYPISDRHLSRKWLIFGNKELINNIWSNIKKATQNGKLGGSSKVATARENKPNITYIYEIIDTSSEFGLKFDKEFFGNDSDFDTYSNVREIRYEKKTGMATLFSIEDILTKTDSDRTYNFELIQIIRRTNFAAGNDDTGTIPGFTLFVSLTTLYVLIYNRKK